MDIHSRNPTNTFPHILTAVAVVVFFFIESTMTTKRAMSEDSIKGDSSTSSFIDDEPPQPVSSDEEEEGGNRINGGSRLFAPYRTIGVVSNGAPFHLIPHDHSGNAMLCLPIGERFQLMQTDRLHPVLVSQAVSGNITHCVADASLSITVVAHHDNKVTLFKRTKPLDTRTFLNRKYWITQTLLHLGRMKVDMYGEKEGKQENAAVVAVVLAKRMPESSDVPIVGDYDDEDSVQFNCEEEDDENALGMVVILIATRDRFQVQSRIPLDFFPVTAVHPSTYLNKIVIGGNKLILLNIKTGKIVHEFKCLPLFDITTLEQSPAVDTVAVGNSHGMVYLINLRLDKLLFSLQHRSRTNKTVIIKSISFRTDASAMQYGIAPMAVGRSDGTITVWDLMEDQSTGTRSILCELDKLHPGGIAKLQYLPQEPMIISTGTLSNAVMIHIFDSPDHTGRLLRQRQGHTSPPTCIRFLGNNGIRADASDGTDASSSCQILSSGASDRTLRLFSTVRSVLDKEYSQGSCLKKKAQKLGLESLTDLLLPPVLAMAMSDARTRDWGDLVTIHKDHAFAYVWSTKRGAQSGPILKQPSWNISAMKERPPPYTNATSVAMSACGNFALVGTRGGNIYRYNNQSGHTRGSYPISAIEGEGRTKGKQKFAGDVKATMKALEKTMKISNRAANLDRGEQDEKRKLLESQLLKKKLRTASHSGYAVTGIAVDSANKVVVSVGTDAKLILWNFVTYAPHKKSPFMLPNPATKLLLLRASDLAAVSLDDFSVILFDCSTQAIVRRFGGTDARHSGPISDMAFSPDGRALYTSSLDSTIRVWDVPTNKCIDWLCFKTPPTSLTLSPTGEYLATSHSGKVGISVWSDRSFYQTIHYDGSHISEPSMMEEPTPLAENREKTELTSKPIESYDRALSRGNADEDADHSPIVPKGVGLVTLSSLSPAHWKNLFYLELVKERNKPKEAPQKPPSAPFFLQWRNGESFVEETKSDVQKGINELVENEEWQAAWSDDDAVELEKNISVKDLSNEKHLLEAEEQLSMTKRRKITRYRSPLASMLERCSENNSKSLSFTQVNEYIASLGPSAIDLALSSLCSGMHDLEDGLPLLLMACNWLLEASESKERYEVVNAYTHRFLYLHAEVIAGVETSNEDFQQVDDRSFSVLKAELLQAISKLRTVHCQAFKPFNDKMQQALCLLRHFSRMV